MRRLFAETTFKLDYIHKEALPHWLTPVDSLLGALSKFGVLGLHKYLPYRIWLRGDLAGYAKEVLSDAQTRRLPYWNAQFLGSLVEEHVRGRRNYTKEINAVMTLEAAERLLIRGSSE